MQNKRQCGIHIYLVDSYVCQFIWRQSYRNTGLFTQIVYDMLFTKPAIKFSYPLFTLFYIIHPAIFQQIRQECELCGLAACASSPICNRTLIGQRDLAAANGWAPSDNCSPVRLLHGWLSDLEQWRDIRASKIEGPRTSADVGDWPLQSHLWVVGVNFSAGLNWKRSKNLNPHAYFKIFFILTIFFWIIFQCVKQCEYTSFDTPRFALLYIHPSFLCCAGEGEASGSNTCSYRESDMDLIQFS